MKKLLLITMILAISCATNRDQPRDTTRMTYLDIGSYSLGIDKKFELIGVLDSELEKENLDAQNSRIHSKEYLFADLSGGPDNIQKGLIVYDNRIKDHQQYWSTEISYENTRVDGKIDSGYVAVGSVRMAYMILRAKPSLDPNVMKVLAAKGPRMGENLQKLNYASMVYFAKLIGRSRNLTVIYIDGKEIPEIAFNESLNYLTLDN